ncbi:MAG: baseplate assembly protein [Thermodesulfobacteriota bacterium]|nr:baseplate assembly protein [Thermodesulfobacteriota bacterium]
MRNSDIKSLMKRVVELVMPDLRSYYRVVRKAKVVKTYASDGQYWADVQPLRNDESEDGSEPVVPAVEIPIMWAGPDRGVVCPPLVGAYCDLSYYDGDPNYPRISNFRWHKNGAPACEVGAFIIHKEAGCYIKIDTANNIIDITDANRQSEIDGDKSEAIGGNKTVEIGGEKTETVTGGKTVEVGANLSETVTGNASQQATGTWTIMSAVSVTVQAPQINLVGNLSATGAGGAVGTSYEKANKVHEGNIDQTGNLTLFGNINVTGNISASGSIMDGSGNSNHHSHTT